MFRYECWKCSENHKLTAREAFYMFRNGFARIGISIKGKLIWLQTRNSVATIGEIRDWIVKR